VGIPPALSFTSQPGAQFRVCIFQKVAKNGELRRLASIWGAILNCQARGLVLSAFLAAANLFCVNAAIHAQEIQAQEIQDLGKLDRFYRATQLQGSYSLISQGLLPLKPYLSYLLAPNVDVPYKPLFSRNGNDTDTEVPFADSFTITRFLGGYLQDEVTEVCSAQNFSPLCADNPPPIWSLDYALSANGDVSYPHVLYPDLSYQSQLVSDRLSPYLQAGYKPEDIGIVLINVPWQIASSNPILPGSPCAIESGLPGSIGPWGQCNSPASYEVWREVIGHLADDLKKDYGLGAGDFRFQVGDESDTLSVFNAKASDFYRLYAGAYTAIRARLPDSSVSPGDFTSGCYNFAQTQASGCVYDSQKLVRRFRATFPPATVPRSLNRFWDIQGQQPFPAGYPSEAASDSASSYAYIEQAGPVVAEIHQFGFLDMPWGPTENGVGVSDVSSLQANWEFQTLMRLRASIHPRRVFNWGGVVTDGKLNFLNGGGFLRIVLDNNQGAELFALNTTIIPTVGGPNNGGPNDGNASSSTSEVMAVALQKGNCTNLIVSNFDLTAGASPTRFKFSLPLSLAPGGDAPTWRYLRYSQSPVDNVFAQVKQDFANIGILDSNFAACSNCFADPLAMVPPDDAGHAQQLLLKNWGNYVTTMQNNLRWKIADPGSLDANGVQHDLTLVPHQDSVEIAVTLAPNEMLVLSPTGK
jgi:hypothetical protein